MASVNRSVKPRTFARPKSKKGKDEKDEKGKKKPVSKSKSGAPESAKEEGKEPAKKDGKAYQPMLPGMRGIVKKDTTKKLPAVKRKAEPRTGRASQPMLPGMGPSKSKKAKAPAKPKEDRFIPGGTDWASMPPVDLNPYNKPIKGKQFNG